MAVFAYLVAAGTAVASLYVYATYVFGLGFPDGFVSELAAAERSLAVVFITVNLFAGCSLVYLGRRDREGHRHRVSRAAFAAVLVLYAAAMTGVAIADHRYQGRLMGSGGG